MSEARPADPLALIVEDDEKLALIFSQALKMASFETLCIRDGQEAFDQLDSIAPVVIVLDMHLPGVSGDRILAKIHRDERLDKTKVIIATADHLMANAFQDQCDLALVKPISFTQLRDLALRIRSTLNVK